MRWRLEKIARKEESLGEEMRIREDKDWESIVEMGQRGDER